MQDFGTGLFRLEKQRRQRKSSDQRSHQYGGQSSEYIRPPGTYYDIIAHPVDRKQAIEVARGKA